MKESEDTVMEALMRESLAMLKRVAMQCDEALSAWKYGSRMELDIALEALDRLLHGGKDGKS